MKPWNVMFSGVMFVVIGFTASQPAKAAVISKSIAISIYGRDGRSDLRDVYYYNYRYDRRYDRRYSRRYHRRYY